LNCIGMELLTSTFLGMDREQEETILIKRALVLFISAN
jgi:hypothetical protein